MAEEKHEQHHLDEFIGPNRDDMSVLNVLLHTIKGISPVAGNPTGYSPYDDEVETSV